MPDLDSPDYTVAQAADALDLSRFTARDWFKDKLIRPDTLRGDVDAPAGGTRKLTLRRVYQLAIMAELVRKSGMSAKVAGSLAFGFSDLSTSPPDPDCGAAERQPGHLYEHARTWLIAHEGSTASRIVRIDPAAKPADLLNTLLRIVRPRYEDEFAVVLPLDGIIERVNRSLGIER